MRAFFILVLFSINSFADLKQFNGNWKGTGIYKYNGEQLYCGLMELSFSGDKALFQFNEGQRDCGKIKEKFSKVMLEIKSNEFFVGNQKVGEYKNNLVSMQFRAPEGNGKFRNWRMSMRKEGNTLVYEESRTMDGEETPLISFAGLLDKEKLQ